MRRRGERLALYLLVLAAGCYWQKYPRLVETHVELLASMARKSEDVFRERGDYRPEDLAEFRYPYDRARDFARIVRGQYGGTSSFRRFEALLDRYETLLAAVDRLNAVPGSEGAEMAEVARLVIRVIEDGDGVLEALRLER